MFPPNSDLLVIDLISKMIKYNPHERISLYEAMTHKVFDELRSNKVDLPNGNCIPDLFCFSSKER